jgi:hypothetical protein
MNNLCITVSGSEVAGILGVAAFLGNGELSSPLANDEMQIEQPAFVLV